jgi:hypothetical protein
MASRVTVAQPELREPRARRVSQDRMDRLVLLDLTERLEQLAPLVLLAQLDLPAPKAPLGQQA